MKITMVPRIIDDNGQEVKENDIVIAQTKGMSEPSLAIINKIETIIVTMTFVDILLGNKPQNFRANDIIYMVKSKQK